MILKYESKIGRADTKGNSTRTIIPKEVINILGLEWGDKIVWKIEIEGKDEVIVSVYPKKHQ